jgi:hypothetical protein
MATLGWNFDITIGKDACEACKTTSKLRTNSALALASRKTTKNLDRLGLYRSRSRSCFTTDGQSVIQSICLGIEHPCGTCDPVGMLLSEIYGLVSVGRPLWLEDGSAICSVESLRTRDHTLLSHLRLSQPGGPGFQLYPRALGSYRSGSWSSVCSLGVDHIENTFPCSCFDVVWSKVFSRPHAKHNFPQLQVYRMSALSL